MDTKDLIRSAAVTTGFTQDMTGDVIRATIDTIIAAVLRGDRVQIHRLGTLKVKRRKAMEGRNPRTGEALTINEHGILCFKQSRGIKQALNGASGDVGDEEGADSEG